MKVTFKNKEVTIHICKRFDFTSHTEFSAAYKEYTVPKLTFIIDLTSTEYLDSSALGMILLIRDHATKLEGSIILKNPSIGVSNVLNIAQFDRLMTIK